MKGIVYRFECKQTGKFYIGSTTQPINKRLKNHKSKAKEPRRKVTPLYSHFNEVGWELLNVVVVVEKEFQSRHELLEHEKEEILKWKEDALCLNVCTPFITSDENMESKRLLYKKRYRLHKKEEYERLKTWRLANPEKYAEQKKRSVERQRTKHLLAKNNVENNTN